ncbi:ribonuclease YeeF family protein [Psychrobacillus sp. NPDC096623]|uniref:ribonuclease YeeF family protein n=1 Tax=Psychrobacillus sp. NPDC096623 TaxID=3364492 RepID=UPI0037F2DD08
MKILDVLPFHDGLQRNINMLTRLEGEINAIQTAVQGLVVMEETLKGEGGNAIRSFYNDCHLPFLHFFLTFKATFNTTLTTMNSALDALESDANGYIRQAYLEGEVEEGLTEISQVTSNLTDESNILMDSVSDIVALPHLDDSGVREGVTSARTSRDNTVTDLNEFDMTQTNALVLIEAAILNMEAWLTDIEYLMNEGLTDINFPAEDWNSVQDATPIGQFYLQHQIDMLATNPRVGENGVGVSSPAYTEKSLWESIMTTVGLDINDWQKKPINAAANFVGFAAAGNATYKDVRLATQGFGIRRETRVTKQGVSKTVIKIDRPELIGVRKKTYSGANATNYEKIYRRVDPATNVKSTFRFSANKLGYIGVFATAGGDIIHGVQNNESASQIAGNVSGDVAVAGVSMAASAWAGAQAGATVGAFGGPVGVVAGAAAGLIAGVVVTTFLSEAKFFDVNNDGKDDSIGDAIKIGTKGLIDSVSSWFK